ncbi:homeobox protein vex1-like [Discoglossus pictus]
MQRNYSVEWLSESSHKQSGPSNVNLPNYMIGYTSLPFTGHYNVQSSGDNTFCSNIDYSEKENYKTVKEERMEPYEARRHFQSTPQESGSSRKALTEVLDWRKNPVEEDESSSDMDSLKSPVSSCEDEMAARPRTKFTTEQLKELEKSFKQQRYIGASEKKRLSKVLKLSEIQIKTWFQNRRMKFKRQSQDARVDAFFSGLYVPYYGYSDPRTPQGPVQPEFALQVPPLASALPLYPLQPVAVRHGHSPSPVPAPNFGTYPYSSILVRPMRNEPTGPKFRPY